MRPAAVPPSQPGPRARLALAAAAGMAALAAIGCLSVGDVLVAYGQPEAALNLPGNSALAAERILPGFTETPSTPERLALARAALANSPVATAALTYLAADARRAGRKDRADRLLSLAAATGWHDETSQRQLYNAAISSGDAARALVHADALLRQGLARQELFAQFDRGMEIPSFRKAMLKVLATSPDWPRDYLAEHGARLSDAALEAALAARATRPGGVERAIVAPIAAALINAGRPAAAAIAWRRAGGADGLGAGTLAWSSEAALETPGPFDWQLATGYRAEPGAEGALLAEGSQPGETARRLLALPPGQWRIAAATGDAAGWRWAVACGEEAPYPARDLATDNRFEVPAGCPVQWLVLAADPAAGQAPPLAPLVIRQDR